MSKYEKFTPIDLDKIETYDLISRPSKVSIDIFAGVPEADDSLPSFLEKLPDVLAVRSMRSVAGAVRNARAAGKPVVWGIGGHVIKTGLAPILIDLMEKGFVTALAVNGAVLVHDAEIAMAGFTSEDVDTTLGSGGFGAAKQTGDIINEAAVRAGQNNVGLGESIGEMLDSSHPPHADVSVLASAYRRGIPVTAHVTIGADIGNFHPSCDAAALGAASHRDFRLLCSIVREMNGGGVYLNWGSAVVLPEIFLKAVTVVRNLGHDLADITTANFDFIQHYRPQTNVVNRPTANGAGRGYSITGHHEIMLPLLAAQILCS
jgi:hypothetical protein